MGPSRLEGAFKGEETMSYQSNTQLLRGALVAAAILAAVQ